MSYIGDSILFQTFAESLHSFTFNLAPAFGSVVLIQTLPVGREYVSAVFHSGTLVCCAIANAGGKYVPAVIPNSVRPSASPPIKMSPASVLS